MEELWLMALKIDPNLNENRLVLSKNFRFRLKNRDVILESKMAELNLKQNLLI